MKFKNVDVEVRKPKKREESVPKGVIHELKDLGKGILKEATSGWGGIIMDQIFGGKKK